MLSGHGVSSLERVDLSVEVTEITPTVLRYATSWLSRARSGLGSDLTVEDLRVLDGLMDADSLSSLHRRTDLAVRGGRTMWIAKPHNIIQ